jgi:RNA polymerase sigma-70 factor (ECF subfamily)
MKETPFIAWISRLVRAQRTSLLRVARREGLSADDAFDAVQEALQSFLTLPQARGLAESDDDARKLLSALVRNVARNLRRRHRRSREHLPPPGAEPDGAPSAEDLLSAAQERMLVLGCMHLLGRVQRAVVTLRLLEGMDGAGTARALRLTPGYVAVLLHRAKEELRECVALVEAAARMRAA